MKRVTVGFSRVYSVELEVEDDLDSDRITEMALAMIIKDESLYSGQLEFDGIEDSDEDDN